MRCLYMGGYYSRFEKVSKEVDVGDSVLELCFGDLYLYENYLKAKVVKYVGVEINPVFIKYAYKKGVNVIQGDILTCQFPCVDVAIIQASLYQFMKNDIILLEKMFNSAKKKIIIAEPIRNIAQSRNKVISYLGKHFVKVGNVDHAFRYNKDSLLCLCNSFVNRYKDNIEDYRFFEITGGRELVVVIDKKLERN